MIDTIETEDLARFSVGKRAGRNTRIRRALIARLLNEQSSAGEEEEEGGDTSAESDDEERQLLRLLAGTRLLKRRRLRRLVLAHLLKERGESGTEEEESEDFGEDEGDNEREFLRLVIGSRILRKRRVRRAVLAHLVGERGETDDITEEGDEDVEGEDGNQERKIARLLIGSRMLRRRRVRRALLAHLLKERAEAGNEEYEEEEDTGDEDLDLERQVARLLIGGRLVRRRRMRRARGLAEYLS